MTWYEIGAVAELDGGPGARDTWAAVLVPLLTAGLVIALGLVLVGLTSGGAADEPTTPPSITGRR
jgi:hypothetical protein